MNVPLLDLKLQFTNIRAEIMAALEAVCEQQQFVLGPTVEHFEQQLADYVGTRYAIGVASGSDALLLSLMALNIQAADEVITVPFTFFSTASAIVRMQARPVFIDIRADTLTMDPTQLERAITPRTKAIIPVHLFGQCADMTPILDIAHRHNIPVIEDACQAIGAEQQGKRAGAFGLMGCFSFFPSKNLGGFGDGGLITTNDPTIHDLLQSLRIHGGLSAYHHTHIGINSRLDAIQAAVLTVKLQYLDAWNAQRRANADLYGRYFSEAKLLEQISLPVVGSHNIPTFHQFTIRAKHRDALAVHLRNRNIGHAIYYPLPLHQQECFHTLGYCPGDLPVSEEAAGDVLSLPIYPELTSGQLASIVEAIAEFYQGR